MITSKLTTLIGAMRLGGAGTFVLGNPYSQTLAALASKLFSNGELGLYYDTNDLYYMYQDMAGSIPVTTAGQQVGLILDKSKGLQLGNELFTIFDSTLSATLSKNTPPCVVTSTTAFGVYGLVGSLTLQPKTYKIEFSWEGNDNNAQMGVQLPNGNNLNIGTEKSGTFSRIMSFTSPGYFSITKFNPQVGQTFTATAVSIKEVLGNHAYQPVNSMRPTLRFNALANSYYLEFDNIDDKLLVTLPAPLTGCTNFRSIPDVGTRARYNQTIPTTFEITSSFASLLIINRSLTFAEKLNLVDKMDKYAGYSGIDSNIIKLFDTEQGFVYDFNDLTAEKLKWRRNLLTETEFRNGLTDVPVRAGDTVAASFAGLNLNTGIRINQQVGTHSYAYKTFTQTVGVLYSFSAYVRMLDGSAPVIGGTSALATEDFAIVLGGRVANLPNRTLTHLGGGLYKVTAVTPDTFLSSSFGFIKYETNSNKGFVVSGYQLEVGTVTTPYQPFTDFNSEFIAAFPYHALYQDAAGIIPVTSVGQPVGLVLDKSKGLTLSPELFNNETVLLSAGVTYLGDSTYRIVSSSALQSLEVRGIPLGVCLLDYTVLSSASGSVRIDAQNYPYQHPVVGLGNKKHLLRNSRGNIAFVREAVPTDVIIRINSIKQVLGNHAYQAVSASRPVLQQPPILGAELLANGSFDTATGWTTYLATLTYANSRALITSTGSGGAELSRPAVGLAGKTVEVRCKFFNRSGGARATLLLWDASKSKGASKSSTASTGEFSFVYAVPADFSGAVICKLEDAVTGSSVEFDDVSIKEVTGYRTDQNCLAFDGVDDFLQTNNIDFTATDKVSVFAGVRKLSDVNTGVVCELSTNTENIGKAFVLLAPSSNGANHYNFRSWGTVGNAAGTDTVSNRPAPSSDVLHCKGQIGTDLCSLTINRKSTYNATGVVDQGTGNYGNYPLYIGRRAGLSLPFSGNLYGLLGVGRLTTVGEATAVERELAKQTGAVLNV